MNARELTGALQGRWLDSYGIARCPAHDDRQPSLSIKQAESGRILVRCHAGCPQLSVVAALDRQGLWGAHNLENDVDNGADKWRSDRQRDEQQRSRRIEAARQAWLRSRQAPGTLVEIYLRQRGISGPIPPTLRYHPDAFHGPTGLRLPAMLAAVAVWPERRLVAVHRTFLTLDGTRKAPVSPDKAMLGPVAGGAVRLAAAGPILAIAEGIETGLSVQVATGLPVWCALSAGGLERLKLPDLPLAKQVEVYADNDVNGRGQGAAELAASRWLAEGREVRVVLPPQPGTDFNDLLRQPHSLGVAA